MLVKCSVALILLYFERICVTGKISLSVEKQCQQQQTSHKTRKMNLCLCTTCPYIYSLTCVCVQRSTGMSLPTVLVLIWQ